jgi:predicted ester cyclase
MEIIDLIAEGEKVAAHFRCSGTHLGEWMGHPPTGRRFHNVDEIYLFRVANGKLTGAAGDFGICPVSIAEIPHLVERSASRSC